MELWAKECICQVTATRTIYSRRHKPSCNLAFDRTFASGGRRKAALVPMPQIQEFREYLWIGTASPLFFPVLFGN